MKLQNFILSTGLIAGVTSPFLFAPPALSDAKVPGTPYHATGDINCSIGSGKMQSCPFGVIRQGNGNGTVVVTKSNGSKRSIVFKKGKAIGYDQSKAKAGKFNATKEGDLNQVHIGKEHYEIPDAVIFGG
ncbi:MAG: hypothetical protein ACRC6M_14425 [Microcystaceae cyanobacterium]